MIEDTVFTCKIRKSTKNKMEYIKKNKKIFYVGMIELAIDMFANSMNISDEDVQKFFKDNK